VTAPQPPIVPAWVEDRTLTVTPAQARASIEHEKSRALAEGPRPAPQAPPKGRKP